MITREGLQVDSTKAAGGSEGWILVARLTVRPTPGDDGSIPIYSYKFRKRLQEPAV
jgi:hypothetical protein